MHFCSSKLNKISKLIRQHYENLKEEFIPGKTKIIKGKVDIGKEIGDVIIGGAEFYQPEDLVGNTVIVIANLESKKIAGIESNVFATISGLKPLRGTGLKWTII